MSFDPATVDFAKGDGLVPAIVQDADTGAVLMMAYMNREALDETLKRRRAVFYSRSKQRLWEKGETTGHTLDLVDVALDCDADTLLLTARPRGPACHNGTLTCFGDAPRTAATSIAFLAKLESVIAQRASELATQLMAGLAIVPARQEPVDDAHAAPGLDDEVRPARAGAHAPVLAGDGLQRAHDGRPNRDHAPRGVDALGGVP